jgi:hypothetical protein
VRLGEQVGVEQPHEVREAVIVAVVRGRGQQQDVVSFGGQLLGELVALGFFGLGIAPRLGLRIGRALVRFVDDDQVPALLPDPLANVVLFGVVKRSERQRYGSCQRSSWSHSPDQIGVRAWIRSE